MEGTRKGGSSRKRLANKVEEASKITGIGNKHASQRLKE